MSAASFLCLAGPTASGKTALALALAERTALEIVSVDSALVYRGMDIGTAKPTPAELAAVPHHLIDIRDAQQAYSAMEFVHDARRLIADIRARGRLPLLVGGTMLYFKALLHGLDELPPADAGLRQQIDARARAEGWPVLHAELARVDPATAARLAPADGQRIQRALEVWHLTGRPLSALHASKSIAAQKASTPTSIVLSLEPLDRTWLHERIARRVDAMLQAGLVDEVRRLRARPELTPELPSMRCVGYRQVWQALDAGQPSAELRDRIVFATRQLAKRQLTWLRSMPDRQIIVAESHQPSKGLLDTLEAAVHSVRFG